MLKKEILEPYNHLLKNPGKDIRSLLIQGFNRWLQVPEDQLSIIKQVIAMLHTASLL